VQPSPRPSPSLREREFDTVALGGEREFDPLAPEGERVRVRGLLERRARGAPKKPAC